MTDVLDSSQGAAAAGQERTAGEEDFQASPGLPAAPGQLVPGLDRSKASQRVSKIPSSGGLSPSTSTAGKSSKFPSDPLASTGSALAFQKHAAARKAAAAGSGDGAPASVAATISKAKEALAQARARAQAAGSLASGVSSRVVEGAVSDKPFTLYGKVDLPPPKPQVKIHPPDAEEAAKRKAWQAEKEALRQRRLQQEAAAAGREAAAKAAGAAARAEEHRKRVEERKARYEAFKAREAELLVKSEAAWKQYQEQRGRPPLYKTMEDEWRARTQAEQEAKRAAWESEVGSAKLATVSQLVSGEVVIKPPASCSSPGRSRSPGAHSPLGSGEYSQGMLGTGRGRSPGRGGSLAASWTAGMGNARHGPPRHLQLVDRASSPLTLPADGSLPPGLRVIPTRLAREEAAREQPEEAEHEVVEGHSAPAPAADHSEQTAQRHSGKHKKKQRQQQQQAAEEEEQVHEEQQEREEAAQPEVHASKVGQPAGKRTSRRGSALKQQQLQQQQVGDDAEAEQAEAAAAAGSAAHSRHHSSKQSPQAAAAVAAAAEYVEAAEKQQEELGMGEQEEQQQQEDVEEEAEQQQEQDNQGADGGDAAIEEQQQDDGEQEQEAGEGEAVDVEASEGLEAAGSEGGGAAGGGGDDDEGAGRVSQPEDEVQEEEGQGEGEAGSAGGSRSGSGDGAQEVEEEADA